MKGTTAATADQQRRNRGQKGKVRRVQNADITNLFDNGLREGLTHSNGFGGQLRYREIAGMREIVGGGRVRDVERFVTRFGEEVGEGRQEENIRACYCVQGKKTRWPRDQRGGQRVSQVEVGVPDYCTLASSRWW